VAVSDALVNEVASGGDLRLNTSMAGMNFLEPYLRGIFAFIGITDIEFVYAHSQTNQAIREAAFTEAAQATRALVAA
jgi:FMN-dependent NADH-azoreductase